MELLKFLGTVAGGVLSRLVADELKTWSPFFLGRIMSIAVKRLPISQQERFAEEWQSDLSTIPGDLTKIVFALGLIRAAGKISWQFNSANHFSFEKLTKRSMDFTVSVFAIILLLPTLMIIAIGIKLTSRGPVFLRQNRIGLGGQPFLLRKFRTTHVDWHKRLLDHLERNPEQLETLRLNQALLHDPRFTPLGRFLRKTSLDELPIFWNILIGEMSVVGPPPIVTAASGLPSDILASYCATKPGITGLWQDGGNSYRERASIWTDLKILFYTVVHIFRIADKR